MRATRFFLLSAFAMGIWSCTEPTPNPKVFYQPFGNRHIDFKQALYKRFAVDDSITYQVDYDRKSKLNQLILENGDTAFSALLTKKGDYWLVSEKQSNGYSIWGFQAKKNLLKGWTHRESIKRAIEKKFTDEGYTHSKDSSFLVMDETIVMEVLQRELINAASIPFFRIENEIDEAFSRDSKPERHLQKFYPNPSSYILNLEMLEDQSYQAKLYNSKGMDVFSEAWVGNHTSLKVQGLDQGNYILAIMDGAGLVLDQERIVIAR